VTRLIDIVKAMVAGDVPPPPVARLVGFRPVRFEDGRVDVAFEAKRDHANPMGTLHGGILCDVADAAMGLAYATRLGEDESFTTLELKINYVRPFWTGPLTAVGRVVKSGRRVGLTECEVTDEHGRLIAKAWSTIMTLAGEEAKGR
jgi:uncharacterized protein (TIGR00369 family)